MAVSLRVHCLRRAGRSGAGPDVTPDVIRSEVPNRCTQAGSTVTASRVIVRQQVGAVRGMSARAR